MNEKPAGRAGNEERGMDESRRQKNLHDKALSTLLRRGDPAGDGRDPSPAEVAAWRQTVLAAARDRLPGRYRQAWNVAMATAGLLLLAVLLVPLLRPSTVAPPSPQVADLGEPAAPDQVAPPARGTGALPDSEPTGRGRETTDTIASGRVDPKTASHPGAGAIRPADTMPPASGASHLESAAPSPARTIRFTAPGGTRIIWKLDPGFSVPHKGEKT
jgi:hypothetical protein